MDKKKTFGMNSIVSILIILGIIVMINLIAMQMFTRVDLTENDIYSLSEFSKKTVGNLDDDITIKAFFTSELPAPYSFNARFLKDQLDDYKTYSNGKLHYEFVDPAGDPELEKEAQGLRIQPVQFNVIENDEVQIKKGYMGLAILYGDKQEVLPVIQSTQALEYDITSAILKITRDEVIKVGFLTGHDEPDLFEDLDPLRQRLSQLYQVMPVDLSNGQTVPDDLKTLVIAGPQEPLSEWEKFAIDQFLMKGGRLALFLDKVNADITTSTASKLDLGLDEWLQTYGVRVHDNLVVDAQNRQITISYRQGPFTVQNMVRYPYIPIINNMNKDNPIVKDLENIDFAFVSTIDTTIAVDTTRVQFQPLAWTSPRSGVKTNNFNLDPRQQMRPEDYSPGHLAVAAAWLGSFDSYFAGKDVPAPEPDTTLTTPIPAYTDPIIERSENTRIVAVGDADFIQQQLQTNPSNVVFFENVVDWLTQDEGLITIRSRNITDRPLDEVSDGKKRFIKFANIFGMPLLLTLVGVGHWFVRLNRKKKGVVLL